MKTFIKVIEKKEWYCIEELVLDSIKEYETVNTNPDVSNTFTINKKTLHENNTLENELEIRLDKKIKDIIIVKYKKEV